MFNNPFIVIKKENKNKTFFNEPPKYCLLYTSDAADE